MDDQQYAMLVLQLSALGQVPHVLDTLDAEQVQNLEWLLDAAKERVAAHRQPQMGQRATCQSCGHPIEYVGPYWRHIGKEYRHIAEPKAL